MPLKLSDSVPQPLTMTPMITEPLVHPRHCGVNAALIRPFALAFVLLVAPVVSTSAAESRIVFSEAFDGTGN